MYVHPRLLMSVALSVQSKSTHLPATATAPPKNVPLHLETSLLLIDQTTPTPLMVNAVEGDHPILASTLPILSVPGDVPKASYQAQ
jgi:hypothetical protein